jgi:hypothetical protein
MGDINRDGVADKIASGPGELFGNGGGPFVVTLGSRKGPPKQFVLNLHRLAATVENTATATRIWSYWHLSGRSGDLCVDTLTDKTSRQCITIYAGDGGTAMGNALVERIFSKGQRLEFKDVEPYVPPPHPDGREWGK